MKEKESKPKSEELSKEAQRPKEKILREWGWGRMHERYGKKRR